jgi:hypothetical protein
MSLRSRLKRLERAAPTRCPACQDRPEFVMRRYRQESPDAQPILNREGEDSGEPCACGWAPEVTELVEVLVRTREEARRVMARPEIVLSR